MQEEKKRSRGRPATGRKRDKTLSIHVTTEEKEAIKEKATQSNKTVADYIIDLVNKN